ncbi:DUF6297 family protein [Nonomuraea sp. LPB2021202275-12-8]|uniref:DUF6297 family protein n=1 Tax=Nonomuraea sp. LPB2021202275-12-8 TaxID=3120159 RepID=UPI00300CC526
MSTHPAASVREVRAFVRSRRRTSPGLLDGYTTLFMLAMTVAVLGRPALAAVEALGGHADVTRMGAGTALLALSLAAALAGARALGPVLLSPSDAAWLVLTPLDRRAVLARPARVLAVLALVAGAVLGLALLSVLGAPDQLTWRLVGAMVLGMSASAGGMALAVLGQASSSWHVWLSTALAVLLVVALVAAFGPARVPLAAAAGAPLTAVAAAASGAAALAALLVRRAWVMLGRMPARSLLAASTRAGHVASAAVTLDPGALTWIAEDNHWRARKLRSARWPSMPAPLAMAWPDWLRLARRPARLAMLAASAALPAVLAQAGAHGPAVGVSVLAGGLAVAATGVSGARRDGDNPALARLLGVGPRTALLARALLPAVLGGVWTASALVVVELAQPAVLGGAGGGWWLFGPLTAPALAAAALRMARRAPVDHSMPVIEMAGGAIPTGPVFWALTGVDLALLGCLPAAMALTTRPAGITAFLVAQALAGAAVLAAFVLRARARRGDG